MKCWECKKKIYCSHRVCYLEYHIEDGLSKERMRDVCEECYQKLDRSEGNYIRVDKITQRSLKEGD